MSAIEKQCMAMVLSLSGQYQIVHITGDDTDGIELIRKHGVEEIGIPPEEGLWTYFGKSVEMITKYVKGKEVGGGFYIEGEYTRFEESHLALMAKYAAVNQLNQLMKIDRNIVMALLNHMVMLTPESFEKIVKDTLFVPGNHTIGLIGLLNGFTSFNEDELRIAHMYEDSTLTGFGLVKL